MVEFKATKTEVETILKVADRVRKAIGCRMGKAWLRYRREIVMDLDACHSNGCPLDFKKMLAVSDADLLHDINGIRASLNRNTGKIVGIFQPRCAK